MKYILVTGGVISGVGKGIISSCLGAILQGLGLKVTAIKIDPYLNMDAGTFSPFEHGEVFVLDDGGEADLDLGNYERFLEFHLNSTNSITTGKIMNKVLTQERQGQYLGKSVQYVPHVTDAIEQWVTSVSSSTIKHDNGEEIVPEVAVIELGGTIGDIESMAFIEAFRVMQQKVGPDNFCAVHVSLILEPKSTGEQKTKPTQRSVRDLRSSGIIPDMLMCRSEKILTPKVVKKLSESCGLSKENVISVPDMPLFAIPQHLVDQKIVEVMINKLQLQVSPSATVVSKFNLLHEKSLNCVHNVKIALVGKYVKLTDAYASVNKALGHAALGLGARLQIIYIESTDLEEDTRREDREKFDAAWTELKNACGILVPGGFDKRGIEGKIAAINYARTNSVPFLGICLGFQCAVIEFARNVLNWSNANSTEFSSNTEYPVVIDMPEHNQGNLGGTMRLGAKKTFFLEKESILYKLYGKRDVIEERHRHRYEVNPKYVNDFQQRGLIFVGKDEIGDRYEMFELEDHPYFVGVQFHPEFLSRCIKASPPFIGLIESSLNKQK